MNALTDPLAHAENLLQQAEREANQHRQHVEKIQSRIAELQRQKLAIQERRKAGTSQPEDLVDYDLAGRYIGELEAELVDAKAAAVPSAEQLAKAADQLRWLRDRHQQDLADQRRQALAERVRDIESVLLQAAAALQAECLAQNKRLQDAYRPADALAELIRFGGFSNPYLLRPAARDAA